MVPPSNWVPPNHTQFGIIAGISGILCMDLAKYQNYIYMPVMAISQISALEYRNYSLTKCTSLLPQIINTDPQTSGAPYTDGSYVILYDKGVLDGKEPQQKLYHHEIENITDQSCDSNPRRTTQVT